MLYFEDQARVGRVAVVLREEAALKGDLQVHRRRALPSACVVLRIEPDGRRRSFVGYAGNISMGGLFIRSDNPRKPGLKMTLELSLPDVSPRKIACTCEVVWARQRSLNGPYKPGMGLRFLDLPVELGEAIDGWARAAA